jgi:hypothetical protein
VLPLPLFKLLRRLPVLLLPLATDTATLRGVLCVLSTSLMLALLPQWARSIRGVSATEILSAAQCGV